MIPGEIVLNRLFTGLLLAVLLTACQTYAPTRPDLQEASLPALQVYLQEGRLSSEELIVYYLDRIASLDKQGPILNAVISLNPEAANEARLLDEERRTGQVRGPLHGIPVLLKDNIDAVGMANSAGSVLLKDNQPPDDAFLVQQLRAAGAVILGKANLSEWANFRSSRSSSGWSSLGGQTRNPYDSSRSTCGSSSGSAVAVAANMVAAAVGTETDGSLVCPAAVNGIVSIKPTLGLISRDGIIPIAHSQDTTGPMARTVSGAVILLEAMAGEDPGDSVSYAGGLDFSRHLKIDGLAGKRIGIVRNLTGYHDLLDRQFDAQLEILRRQGAILIDKVELPTLDQWDDDEFTVLLHEFRQDLAAYLQASQSPYRSLADLIVANDKHAAVAMPLFGQELFLMAEDSSGEEQQLKYEEALQRARRLAGAEGIDAAMDQHRLDLLIAPTTGPAWKIDYLNGDHFLGSASSAAAVAGYPHITVPMGFVQVAEEPALPVGISFFGRARSEAVLIEAAYGYEQATQHRVPPSGY
ncbi:amidase [Bowmanella dokdonensis]|uniref:Amidase n=1 Tax=Bowmanella dokdonensis TaxID=751969 RepID=A0A939IPV6_9ALTE|nr:amidase [Bowmanella dokdonensis]